MIDLHIFRIFGTPGNCHPERSSSRALRTAQSKNLRLLLPLLVLLLTARYSPAQHSAIAGPHFSGQAAYNLTAQLLQVAPKRYNGSLGHLKAAEFIQQHFAAKAAKGKFDNAIFTARSRAGLQ